LIKTHKQTIYVTVAQTSTVKEVKQDAFSALTDAVNQAGHVPNVNSLEDFELCKAVKDKSRGVIKYDLLNPAHDVKTANISNWETLYLQFRDDSNELLPVEFTQPPLIDEDDDDLPPEDLKGKRKAD
jgi:hypothetical protein